MTESDIPSLIALGGLISLSAFFSGSETALIGSKRVALDNEAEKGNRAAKRALKLLDDPGSLLGTILVGNNLVNVAAAAIAAVLLGPFKATVVMTLLLLMIGEIPPKTLSSMWPERISKLVAYPITLFQWIFKPVVWITTTVTYLLLWPITRNMKPKRRFFSEEEIRLALDRSQDAGELEPGEARMAQEVLDLDKIRIEDIMIPLAEAACLERDWPLERVIELVRRRRFSRYPVFLPDTRQTVGILHIKDLVVGDLSGGWQAFIRSLPLRPKDMDADDLLRDMQIARFHMAAVVDEGGEVIGFVMMERILEEIVGEIADEHAPEADPVQTLDTGVFCVRGDLEVADVARILNVDLNVEDPEQTIAALYREACENKPTSAVRIGQALIRSGKRGYIVQIMDWSPGMDEE